MLIRILIYTVRNGYYYDLVSSAISREYSTEWMPGMESFYAKQVL